MRSVVSEPYLNTQLTRRSERLEFLSVERVYSFDCGWCSLSWVCPGLGEDAYDIVSMVPQGVQQQAGFANCC